MKTRSGFDSTIRVPHPAFLHFGLVPPRKRKAHPPERVGFGENRGGRFLLPGPGSPFYLPAPSERCPPESDADELPRAEELQRPGVALELGVGRVEEGLPELGPLLEDGQLLGRAR